MCMFYMENCVRGETLISPIVFVVCHRERSPSKRATSPSERAIMAFFQWQQEAQITKPLTPIY